jgi:hypothetical protein
VFFCFLYIYLLNFDEFYSIIIKTSLIVITFDIFIDILWVIAKRILSEINSERFFATLKDSIWEVLVDQSNIF